MSSIVNGPPRPPPAKYDTPLGTRWAKERAAAGGESAFDPPTDPKYIGPWILGECVGKGASGRVKIAKHRRTGQLAAVKILPIAPLINSRNFFETQAKYNKYRLGIDREITMMKLMNHPNIMRIYDVFEGEKELFLVLEYVEGGELFDFLVNRGKLLPQEALEYFKQIIYGLNYAHTFSIIHRDLKPENILIASLSPPLVKIADWGMAAFAPPTLRLETCCGSPHYVSPEIINGEKYQGNATDIWSCGVILYALLTGRLPFDGKNVRTLLAKIQRGIYDIPTWIDPLPRDLLCRMLVVDVAKRITIPEILVHPWLTSPVSANIKGRMMKQPTPPLPPSPNTLARPIASPELIDPELFSSLRVIWGKYADPAGETIKKDLCAPAGQGVYTKAFYYLLSKYREESYRKRLTDGEDMDEIVGPYGVSVLRFDHCWKGSPSDVKVSVFDNQRQSAIPPVYFAPPRRRVMSSSAQSSIPQNRRLSLLTPPMDRTRAASKDRLSIPAGPRPIPSPQQTPCRVAEHHQSRHSGTQAARPVFSISTATRTMTPGMRPQPSRRGYTFSHPTNREITFEGRPADSRTLEDPSRTAHEEGRRNTVMSVAPAPAKRPNVRETRIPSPTFQGTCSPLPDCRNNAAERSPLDVRSPRINLHDQSREKHSLNAITSTSAVPSKSSNGMWVRAQTHIPVHAKGTDNNKNNGQKRHLHFPNNNGEDKENQSLSIKNASVVPSARRASGVGLGMGINNTRDVFQEMGNVIYIGTGNTPLSKGKKERKNKPPALDLQARRTTLSALGSPTASSSPMVAPPDTGSPARLLTSPVMGEFKGWFSNLFSWKNNGQASILYSPNDMAKTCGDVGRLLESLSIIVMLERPVESSESPQSDWNATTRLKCRVEELSVDTQTNICLKPVRFRVEFTPIQQTRPPVRQFLWSPPLSPITDNTCFFLPPTNEDDNTISGNGNSPTTMPFLSAPNPGLTPRVRTSMLPVVIGAPPSGQNTPMPSPGMDAHVSSATGPAGGDNGGPHIPYGSLCGILLVYEKGSMSSFKIIWRKVKDVYCGSPARASVVHSPEGFGAFSPMMASTPISQDCLGGQFTFT